ncbi:hypothetical protein P7C70_g752, partial [Phenoliferia sp. Uapishka_3]
MLRPEDLPIDLITLSNFILADPVVQALAQSATNSFFAPYKLSSGGWRVGVREKEGHNWGALPREWREFFLAYPRSERQQLLTDLANGESNSQYPPSLERHIQTCRALSLPRTQSDVPIISYSLSDRAFLSSQTVSAPPEKERHKPTNKDGAGLGPKKWHEVVHFCRIVGTMMDGDDAPTHCLDVGSGRAHLSRKLAAAPLELHVLALDWSPSQLAGAEKLDISHKGRHKGSLTHRISSLDADGITEVLYSWPTEGAGALLVALHACGDLTPDALKAFVRADGGDSRKRKMVAVGCCYNLLSVDNATMFPLSRHLSSLPTPPLHFTRDHLLLTAQAPPTWHTTPTSISALSSSLHKLAYRSRFSAEVESLGPNLPQPKCGRIGDSTSYTQYRQKALAKLGLKEEDVPRLRFGVGEDEERDWEDGCFQLQIYWTLKSLPGPAIESLFLLDRFAFLVEGLGKGDESNAESKDDRRVELVNLFDQATGSLRNVALVVR